MPKKRFSLVFWSGLGYSSVVETEKIKTSTKSSFVMKSRNKNLRIKIILQDDDEEYFNNQTVDKTGKLIQKAIKPPAEVESMEKRGRGRRRIPKELNAVDTEIVGQPSIFATDTQNDLTADQSGPSLTTIEGAVPITDQLQSRAQRSKGVCGEDVNQSNDHTPDGRQTGDIDSFSKNEPNSKAGLSSANETSIHSDEEETGAQRSKHLHHPDKEQIENSSDTESSESKSHKRQEIESNKELKSTKRSQNSKKLRKEKSSDGSSDSSGSSSYKKLFEEFMKWRQEEKSEHKSKRKSKKESKKHLEDKKPKSKKIELVEKSGIIVNRFQLDIITETYKKNPREMTRQLCKLIIGTDELAKMNITQTKGREQMPNKPLEAIFDYVTINTADGRELTVVEFRNCVERMLSGIRESLKSSNDGKNKNNAIKNRKNDVKDDSESDG